MLLMVAIMMAISGLRHPMACMTFFQRTYALICATRHEAVNGRFKCWRCLKQQWRHCLEKHGATFRAIGGIVQLSIQHGEQLFQVQYNEDDLESDWDEISDWEDLE